MKTVHITLTEKKTGISPETNLVSWISFIIANNTEVKQFCSEATATQSTCPLPSSPHSLPFQNSFFHPLSCTIQKSCHPGQGDVLFPVWLVAYVPSASCALRLSLSKSISYIPLRGWKPLPAFSFSWYNFTHLSKKKSVVQYPLCWKNQNPPPPLVHPFPTPPRPRSFLFPSPTP